MDVCSHLKKLHLGTNTTILNPEKWLCFICGTTESVWACLICGNVACGRLNNEHALKHFNDKKHPLAIEVNNRYVYCYECDEYIYGDNTSGDLALLRDALSAITTQRFDQVESRGQKLLRSYSNTEITSRSHADENDRIATAVCHYGRVILCKVFSAWHFYVQQQKINQEQSSTPKKRKLDIPMTPPSARKRTLIPGVTGLRNLGNTCYMNSILQCLGLADYENRKKGEAPHHLVGQLSEFERKILTEQEVMTVRGKTGRGVPVILPAITKAPLSYLTDSSVRSACGISSKNVYVFAGKGEGVIRAYNSVLKACSRAPLKSPQLITSTNLRKYMATVTQVFDLKPNEMNWVLDHLGHSMDVHKIHYRHLDDFRDFILDLDFSNVWSPVGTPSARIETMPYKPSTRTNHRLNTSDYFQHLSKPVKSPCESRNKGGLSGGEGFSSSSAQLHSSFNLNNMSLWQEIHGLLRVLWSGKWAQVSPHAFLHTVWNRIPVFKGHSQHDAQEFLCELLDKLEDEVSLLPEYSHHSNILADTFQGQLISQVTCLKCDNQSSTHEPYLDLSLEFPDRYQITSSNTNVSNASCQVTEMLTKFTEIEMLEGPIYACEFCNRKQVEAGDNKPSILSEACKQLLLNKLPPVLRLHLKRFRWSGRYHREKISTHVSFDEDLDMSPYCSDSVSWTSCTYRLSGVVVHHGWGFGSGHYTAYCWSSEAESWLDCNDSRVEFCSLGDVQKSQAYILFYTQVTTDISDDSLATPLESFETVPCSESESFSENSLMVDEEITFNFKNSDSFHGENSSAQNTTPPRLKMKRRRTTF